MTLMQPIMPIRGTRLPVYRGLDKQLGTCAQAWRQHPTVFLGIGVSTSDNSTRVSEVEHRHR